MIRHLSYSVPNINYASINHMAINHVTINFNFRVISFLTEITGKSKFLNTEQIKIQALPAFINCATVRIQKTLDQANTDAKYGKVLLLLVYTSQQ